MKKFVSAITLLCFGFAGAQAVLGADTFAAAISLYNARKYAEAEAALHKYLETDPQNADAHYYLASCYQYQRKFDQAKNEYLTVMSWYTGTKAAEYSRQALTILNNAMAHQPTVASPAAAVQTTTQTASASAGPSHSSADYIPDEEFIPYTRGQGGHFYVRPVVNGRSQEMIFDTGAEMTVMGTRQWASMGLPKPAGPYDSSGSGVSGTVGMWRREVDISLGKIKKHMDMHILDSPDIPGLLGESFFGDLEYNMDSRAGYIHFFKKGQGARANAVPYNSIDIPFRKFGQNMMVTAKINGIPIDCIFDTGAGVTLIGCNHMAQLGLTIPSDAKMAMSSGVGGSRPAYMFPVNTMEVGDLRKTNFEIMVSSVPQMMPLIGQTFFGDRKYVIDNDKMLIRFTR